MAVHASTVVRRRRRSRSVGGGRKVDPYSPMAADVCGGHADISDRIVFAKKSPRKPVISLKTALRALLSKSLSLPCHVKRPKYLAKFLFKNQPAVPSNVLNISLNFVNIKTILLLCQLSSISPSIPSPSQPSCCCVDSTPLLTAADVCNKRGGGTDGGRRSLPPDGERERADEEDGGGDCERPANCVTSPRPRRVSARVAGTVDQRDTPGQIAFHSPYIPLAMLTAQNYL
uniref:Uncharacterized protein n=1 Tax=Plectus sambesii TaxID=2011161 RepID=A0A914WIG3_9BILA